MENDGLLLKYKNNQRLLIREGIIYLLSLERPEGEYELYQLSYSEEGNWGDDDGKTVTYFKSVLAPEMFDEDDTKELASGEVLEFRTDEWDNEHYGFFHFLALAFVQGECVGHLESEFYRDDNGLGDKAYEFVEWMYELMDTLNKMGKENNA